MVFRLSGWIVAGTMLASFWGCKPRELPLTPPSTTLGSPNSAPVPTASATPDQNTATPEPPPKRPQDNATWAPSVAQAESAGDAPANAEVDGDPPASDQQSAPPAKELPNEEQKRYTWAEMEQLLADLREKGKTDPIARETLVGWYNRLRSPAFTEAESFEKHLENLKLWQEELPESPTALVVLGDAYIDYAWQARGDGFANTVTEEGWKLFHERIIKAHELLDKAIQRGVPDGQAYARMLIVAKAEGMSKEEARAILAAGNKVDPTYMSMYGSMADYLLPKWHGEPGDVAKFIKEVVEMVPGDDGLDAVARIIAGCHSSDRTILYWGGIKPETLSAAGKVFLDRYPKSEMVANYAGILAWASNDRELGLRVLDAFIKNDHSPDTLAWGSDKDFSLFDRWCRASAKPTSEKYRLQGSLGSMRTLAWSTNTRYVWIATHEAYTPILLIDTHTGEAIQHLRLTGFGVHELAFDPNQRLLAASAVGRGFKGAIVWDVITTDEPFLIPLEGTCNVVSISPVSPLVAVHDGTNVHLVNVENHQIDHTLSVPDQYVNALIFSQDGSMLATYAQHEVAVWDVETGKKKHFWPADYAKPQPEVRIGMPYRFDDENKLVADYIPKVARKGSIGGLGRFTPEVAEPETLLPGVLGGFRAISPDGKYFAIDDHKSGQREVMIWDLAAKAVARRLEGHALPLSYVSFSPDGKLLATGSADGELKIWEFEPANNVKETPPQTP